MKVRFTAAVRDDIASLHAYIARENSRAAAQVVSAIERATVRLADFSASGRRGAVEGTRELVVPRLPFIAVYRVTETHIEVVAVFHAAQDRPRGIP